uniref:CVNH domain-containing protein n=1 Tax=Gongylonema pulchrum TaxID=637853 RepID=A0A183EDQ8_9BILA
LFQFWRIFFQTANVQPAAESITAHATVHKNGRDFGAANIVFPKQLDLPSQKYRGEFNWNYQNRPHKALVEYNRQTDPRGSMHDVNLQSDDNINLNMHLDHHDKIHLKCDLDKDRVRTVSAELSAAPFRSDLFEVKGHLSTDRPLQRRSLKTKASFTFRTDQVLAL